MKKERVSRRYFLGASAVGAGVSAFVGTQGAVAQAVKREGIDAADLTIKEVKIYIVRQDSREDGGPGHRGQATTQLLGIVTNAGIEGNFGGIDYSSGRDAGFLEYAKDLLIGRSVLDLPAFTSVWDPTRRRHPASPFAARIDYCLWDILGKAANLPVYKLLGAYRDRVLAYASSMHLNTVEDFVEDVKRAKAEGYKGYKIHPPWVKARPGAQIGSPTTLVPNQGKLNLGGVDFNLDVEVAKAVRAAGGDDMLLLHDRVGAYTRDQALKMGRLLDRLNFVAMEDPLPSVDIAGLTELCRRIDTPVHMGEMFYSIYDYDAYIRARALDVVRFIGAFVGGITGGMKLAKMAECFGMECAPHNYGDTYEHAVHFHCELAMPNNVWFEMMQPTGVADNPYVKDKLRIDKDGYVRALPKPGLGLEIDRGILDNLLVRIES